MSSFITRYPPTQPTGTATSADNETSKPKTQAQPSVNYTTPSHHNHKYQITPHAASSALRRLIAVQLSAASLDGSEPEVFEYLERLVADYITRLTELAHEYATLSNRPSPNSYDMLSACEDHGITIRDLKHLSSESKRLRKHLAFRNPKVINPPAPSKKPELLPSDSEGDSNDEAPEEVKAQRRAAAKALTHPPSLRSLPSHFPPLPPKHTYLRTEAPPPTSTTLSSLQQKIDNAAIIQESLRNLIQQTDITPRPREAEDSIEMDDSPAHDLAIPTGLGGFVNWEAASGLRKMPKRWKL